MKKLTPFNIDLLIPTNQVVSSLRPTTKTDIYEGITSNFNDDGLFSTITFGRVGSPERDDRFSYVKLNADVIHPAIFKVLKRLKTLYAEIIMGQSYAVWDAEAKDFKPSDMIFGETGMAFFCRHLHELTPSRSASKKRDMYVDVLLKYQQQCLMRNHLIIPAGMRDLEVDPEGREIQDEINDLYRKLLFSANSINLVGGKTNDPSVDTPRRNLQLTTNEIYENLKGRLEGKQGLIAGKWGGRKLTSGTRNVISCADSTTDELYSPRMMTVDHVLVGLFQTIKGTAPLTINKLKERFLNEVFIDPNNLTTLINPLTLELEEVDLDPWTWDRWGTSEGIEKQLNAFSIDEERNNPVTIGDKKHYLYLVYRKDNVFKLFRDINELPEGFDRQYVKPLTYGEMYYLCNYEGWYDLFALITRYPVTGMQSILPCRIYLKTTNNAQPMYELGNDWKTQVGYAREYPDVDAGKHAVWFNTASPHASNLQSLGADFDGDMISVNYIFSDEATAEIRNYLQSTKSLLNASGGLLSSNATNIPNRVFACFTG